MRQSCVAQPDLKFTMQLKLRWNWWSFHLPLSSVWVQSEITGTSHLPCLTQSSALDWEWNSADTLLPSFTIPASHKLGMVAQTCNPSTLQVEEARESVVQGHCQLYTEFKDSPHLKPKKQFYSKKIKIKTEQKEHDHISIFKKTSWFTGIWFESAGWIRVFWIKDSGMRCGFNMGKWWASEAYSWVCTCQSLRLSPTLRKSWMKCSIQSMKIQRGCEN